MMDKLKSAITDDRGVPLALARDERGQVGTIIAVLTVAVVAIIGILIYSQVLDSLGDPSTTDAGNRTELENSTVDVTEGVGSAMQLIPVVLIVLVASVVIAVVQRFG